MTNVQRMLKRALDVCLAALGLLVFWPLIFLCVVIATLDSKAFGIFRQRRVGRHGIVFSVCKVRTMSVTESTGNTTITTVHDARITQSGRIMRRLKLDELPQLWNVLVGQMSFVGPRPDVPGYADKLSGEQRRMLELRPGITGPATIKYTNEEQLLGAQENPEKYNDTVLYPDKVRINLEYLDNYSIIKDIRYILITLRVCAVPEELGSISPSNHKH